MSELKERNQKVAGIALRLEKRTSCHLFTSYTPPEVPSTPTDETELSWEDFPGDDSVAAAEVDPEDWPEWTDLVPFTIREGGAP